MDQSLSCMHACPNCQGFIHCLCVQDYGVPYKEELPAHNAYLCIPCWRKELTTGELKGSPDDGSDDS